MPERDLLAALEASFRRSTAAPLTEPQVRMLRAAATGHRGETWIRRGQGRTADALAAMGYGSDYMPDSHSRKFAINDAGRRALDDAGLQEAEGHRGR